jgi:hypothetical protein
MAQQSPNNRSGWDPRGWGTAKILVLLAALAAFIAMLTWDGGHFPGEQATPPPAKQVK